MKYLPVFLLLLIACKKEEPRNCYKCSHKYTAYTSQGNQPGTAWSTVCDKTEREIKNHIDSAPFGQVGSRIYQRMQCEVK